MGFQPLFSVRATTIIRAFLLNALLIGITTAFTIEARRIFNESKYTRDLPDRPHKLAATAVVSVAVGFTSYVVLRYLFGFGGGMLAPSKAYPTFL